MTQLNTITCPECKQIITYDVYGLLSGQKYSCPGCSMVISLSEESHDTLQTAMEKFEKLKQDAGKR